MSKRIEAFRALADHPIFKGCYSRLNATEREACEKFIADNDALEYGPFNAVAVRWGLGEKNRNPRQNDMYGLVTAANGSLFKPNRRKK